MATFFIVLAVLGVLMFSALKVYGLLDGMVSKAQTAIKSHVPGMKQKVADNFNTAPGYVKPRAAGWARRLALGCVAHLAVFFGSATCMALVRPAPQEVTYASIAKREDASWFQHSMAYVGYGTGWVVDEVKPGFLYSTARLTDGTVLVGPPGVQQWYQL
jgi:hypothetical protein